VRLAQFEHGHGFAIGLEDIVSTGTPEGIGPIRLGDAVVCRIQNIGELGNPVRNR
jgi:2-keto-4-pentenoate hydratase/2-oxohepta-3-ene-1,7-dioic acid hydratase in catechol pathway